MKNAYRLCVFCSASDHIDPAYTILAREFGERCAALGWHVVYGGGRAGLMGILADAALNAGGEVTGVIPRMLKAREIAHTGLTKLEVVEDMHQRQRRMMDLSQGFAILPGGMGTLAECFEVLTWKQLGLHQKPIAILNAHDYWSGLLIQLEKAGQQGFMHHRDHDLFKVFRDLNDVILYFQNKIV